MKTSEKYLFTTIDGQPVALPLAQNELSYKSIIKLNSTGAFICKCLETDLSLSELHQKLYKEFECCEDEKAYVDRIVDEFVEGAVKLGVIVFNN